MSGSVACFASRNQESITKSRATLSSSSSHRLECANTNSSVTVDGYYTTKPDGTSSALCDAAWPQGKTQIMGAAPRQESSSAAREKQNGTTPTTRIARCPRAIHHLLASAGPSIDLIRTKIEQPSQDIPNGQESERIMHPPEEENSQEPFQRLHSSQDRLLQLW